MKRTIALCVSVLMTCSLSLAQETDDPFAGSDESAKASAPKVVRVQLEYIEMLKGDLTRLLMEEKAESADATALRMKVQALVDKQEAEVIDTQLVVSRSGAKATSESRHEFIFPASYEPPRLISHPPPPPDRSWPAVIRRNQGIPTAFETRYLGSNLEVQATATGGARVVDFVVSSTFTWHTGDTVWREWKGMDDANLSIRMPAFYAVEVSTTGVCISGKYALLSVVAPKNAKGELNTARKVMVFVKCDVLEVK